MLPEDLDLLRACARPALTPDGSVAVVPVLRPDTRADRYRGGLWAVPTDGTPPRRLTGGERDVDPAVSPDGTRVAFLRAQGEGKPQIHVLPLAGGEPVRLTDHPLGAAAPVWCPDGRRLAYTARVPEPGRYGTDGPDGEPVAAEAEAPRLVTELAYRRDDLGYTRDRRQHLFVLDVPAPDAIPGSDVPELPEPRQLTSGDQDDELPAWSPDGSLLAFVSSRHQTRESDLRSAVHVVPAGASELVDPAPVTGGDLSVGAVQWWDGDRLVVVAREVGPSGRDFVGRPGKLLVTATGVSLGNGPVELRPLTDDDHDIEDGAGALVLLADRALVRELRHGAVRLLAVGLAQRSEPAEPEEPAVLLGGRLAVTGHAAAGATVVAVASTPDRAADLALVTDDPDGPSWLTDVSAPLRAAGLVGPREVNGHGADGYPVHGWVLLPDPASYGEGPHPVLLTIHGGPFTQYDWGLFDEAQVYAGAGYAVVMCNPRGSAGYGFDHGRAVRGSLGTVDADDVLGFLEHVLSDQTLPLDRERVGVMGGSYGGYMTATLTTRTDRFVGAIVERGYLDGASFVGSSDIGWYFPGEYHGDLEKVRAQSPMTRVDQVTTPTLVIHSEADWRCPVEQGQRWFTSLRMRGVPTRLLLFPGESHELSRSGRPRHRRQRFEHILAWWAEYLPVVAAR